MQTKTHPLKKILAAVLLCAALISGFWLWYDANVDRSGWTETENGIRYLDFHGKPVTGWQEIDGQHYFFRNDNTLATFWQQIGGNTYYLGQDGVRVSGWQEIGGQRYCFAENGTMCTGWVPSDGRNCYLGTDGLPASGWLEDGGHTYYLDETGFPVTGNLELDGNIYLFEDPSGIMYTGWQNVDGQSRYYRTDGTMATGFTEIGGDTYCFAQDGTQLFGWLTQEENTYYFQSNGTMVTGPMEIDGEQHYFSPHGVEIVLVNPWNRLPENLDIELVFMGNWQYVDKSCADALTQMLDACRAAGLYPYVCSSYRTYEDQQFLMDNKIERLMEEKPELTEQQAYTIAKQSVAVPGTSEHQLGLAVDIVADGYYVLDYTQAKTDTQQWLMENCWDYGFILRYPEDKTDITGIIYEPWHYRYVGVEIALEMKELGITLEEYLGAVVTD